MPQTFEVCYEDPQLLVVNKRAGVATMGVTGGRPSLLAAARQYLGADHGDADGFAAVTGRLDFPVAGLVVIAKDPAVADDLRRQLEQTEATSQNRDEQASVLQDLAGTMVLTHGSKTLTIVYTDVGFMPAEVSIDATGIKLQRAAK